MRKLTWTPKKATERTAIIKHGKVWIVDNIHSTQDQFLIWSPDKSDLRWINKDQVMDISESA